MLIILELLIKYQRKCNTNLLSLAFCSITRVIQSLLLLLLLSAHKH